MLLTTCPTRAATGAETEAAALPAAVARAASAVVVASAVGIEAAVEAEAPSWLSKVASMAADGARPRRSSRRSQPLARTGQAAANRSRRAAQTACRLCLGKAPQMEQHQRRAVLFRQPADLLVEHEAKLVVVQGRWSGLPSRASTDARPRRPSRGLGVGLPRPWRAAPPVWRPCTARFPAGRHPRSSPPSAPGSRTWPGRRLRHRGDRAEPAGRPPEPSARAAPGSPRTQRPRRIGRTDRATVLTRRSRAVPAPKRDCISLTTSPHCPIAMSPILLLLAALRSPIRDDRRVGHSIYFWIEMGFELIPRSSRKESSLLLCSMSKKMRRGQT